MSIPEVQARTGASPLDVTPDYTIARIGNVVVSVWRGPNSLAALDLQERRLRELVAAHPKNCGFLCVVEATSPAPEKEMRVKISDTLKSLGDSLSGVATVVGGTGIRPMMVRTILTGVASLKRQPQSTEYFSDVRSALEWMAGKQTLSAIADLTQKVEALRAHAE